MESFPVLAAIAAAQSEAGGERVVGDEWGGHPGLKTSAMSEFDL